MRTNEEIIKRISEIDENSIFDHVRGDLLYYLDFESLKHLVKEELLEEFQEKWVPKSQERELVLKEAFEYMSFAWDKANNFRGLSAMRSLDHYKAWLFILGDEDKIDFENYNCYGKNVLAKICELYSWDYSQWDDNIRSDNED